MKRAVAVLVIGGLMLGGCGITKKITESKTEETTVIYATPVPTVEAEPTATTNFDEQYYKNKIKQLKKKIRNKNAKIKKLKKIIKRLRWLLKKCRCPRPVCTRTPVPCQQ